MITQEFKKYRLSDVLKEYMYPYLYSSSFRKTIQEYPDLDLIENHPDFNPQDALNAASEFGYMDLMGTIIDKYDVEPLLALYHAAKLGDIKVINILLDHGDEKNEFAISESLSIAAENGHLPAVRVLSDLLDVLNIVDVVVMDYVFNLLIEVEQS